jgi:Ca2+/H+ antiporter
MKLKFLNKTIENTRFQYNPLYYDERKEKLKQKKEQYRKIENNEMSDEERRKMFRENLHDGWSRAHYRQTEKKSSNYRIIILIVLILVLGYFVFNGVDHIDKVITKIW